MMQDEKQERLKYLKRKYDEAGRLHIRANELRKRLITISGNIDRYFNFRTAACCVGIVTGIFGAAVGLTLALGGAGLLLLIITGIVTTLMEKNAYKRAADSWDEFYSDLNSSELKDEIGKEMEKSTNKYVRNAGRALWSKESISSAEEIFRDRPVAQYIFTGQTLQELLIWLFQLREKPSVHIGRFNEDELNGLIEASYDIGDRSKSELENK